MFNFFNIQSSTFLSNVLSSVSGLITFKKDGDRFDNDLYGSFFSDRSNGRAGDDTIYGGFGKDFLRGGRGNDYLDGGLGNDRLNGGRGDDTLVGGSGNDRLKGGDGSDIFVFNPANDFEGRDVVRDFTVGEDLISLDLGNILKADPNVLSASGNVDSLEFSDLDVDASWSVSSTRAGDVKIVHPGGEIVLKNVPFGENTDSFAELAPAVQITTNELDLGTGGNDDLSGSNDDDVLYALDGNDTLFGDAGDDLLIGGAGADALIGEDGDDVLVGGSGADNFFFNPNNFGEGNDVVIDFEVGVDKVVLSLSDVLDSTPGLLEASGDPNALEVSDFDAIESWIVESSEAGNVSVKHPNGNIEFEGIAFSAATDSFVELANLGVLQIDA